VTTATQSVDVSASAEGIDDGRATASLSAYLGGALKYADNMRVSASFLAADGSALGELTVGPVSAEDRHNVTELLRRAANAPVPAGTRAIRVVVTSTDTDTASSAIADNVKLTLSVRDKDPVVVNDPPPPPPRQEFGADTKVTVGLVARRVGAREPIRVRVSNGNAFGVTGTLSARKLKKRFSVAASGRTTVKLRLGKALRRKLERRHKLVVRFSATVTDPAGNRRTVPKKATLRLKAKSPKRR
jgi:hypothetical protein